MTPQDIAHDIKAVFVYGTAHSATTILYRMLAHHPEFAWFSQFSLRRGELPTRRAVPLSAVTDRLLRRAMPHDWRKEESWRRFIVPRPGEAQTIWDSLLAGEADELRRVLTQACHVQGKRAVLCKLPAFSDHLDLLHEAFPSALFVQTVRDPRPLALSIRAKRGLEGEDGLRRAVAYWTHVVDAPSDIDGLDSVHVRYEELCADVPTTLRALFDRAGLTGETFPWSRVPDTLTNRNGRWLDGASQKELELVADLTEEQLITLGYETGPRNEP